MVSQVSVIGAGQPANEAKGPARKRRRVLVAPYIGFAPAIAIILLAYVVTLAWTVGLSFTDSKLFPTWNFIGLKQYQRLFSLELWRTALNNMVVFGVLMIGITMAIGYWIAAALDQRIRGEGLLRTIFLYPYSMSFVVTGVAWGWLLNPELGVQKAIQGLGLPWFRLDWILHAETALLCVVAAAVWHATGLVTIIFLAGMRGVDPDLWKAARIDNIPTWRMHLHVIIPMLGPSIASIIVLLSLGVVKLYDLVLVLTSGGPAMSTEVPAKVVMSFLFERNNIGVASAGATVMLALVLGIIAVIRIVRVTQGWRTRRQG